MSQTEIEIQKALEEFDGCWVDLPLESLPIYYETKKLLSRVLHMVADKAYSEGKIEMRKQVKNYLEPVLDAIWRNDFIEPLSHSEDKEEGKERGDVCAEYESEREDILDKVEKLFWREDRFNDIAFAVSKEDWDEFKEELVKEKA